MAQKVLVELVDDMDGSVGDDVTTVEFGLDGVTYEIDLSGDNAEKLRAMFADYQKNARRTAGRARRGVKPTAVKISSINGKAAPAAEIREWAKDNNIPLSNRGRIPANVEESYRQAKAEEAAAKPPAKRGTTPPAFKSPARSTATRGRAKKS